MKAFFLLVFSSLMTISSQSNASDNCNNLKTQLEMNACAANEYQREDAKLNEYYKELAGKLGPSEKERLKAGSVTFCVGTESGPNARSVRLEHSQPT